MCVRERVIESERENDADDYDVDDGSVGSV